VKSPNDKILDEAVSSVVEPFESKWLWLTDFVPGSMLAEDYDPFQMLQFELMAITARSQFSDED
tara:strand:- start:84 stop:275 length:192 start_codon:yes stop_codon:yes gene_type:complete